MTPEQREELKAAAQDLHDADDHTWPTYQARFKRLVGTSSILSLIAQVEALTVPQVSESQRNAVYMALHYHMQVQTPDEWKATDEAIAAFLAAAPTIPAIPGTKEGA